MELYKKCYKGIFVGRNNETWKITRYTMIDVLRELLDYINQDDEGIIEICEMDIRTKKRELIKRVIVVNDVNLTPTEEIPLKF